MMPTLRLKSLLCARPKGIERDHVFINLRTEDISRVRDKRHDEYNQLWGPVRMEEDTIINFVDGFDRDRLESIEFLEYASIQLMEADSIGSDDSLGSFRLTRGSEYDTNQSIWLPGGLTGPNHQSYRLIYDLEERPLPELNYRLALTHIFCVHPQGTRDEVQLIVNGTTEWSSRETGDMREGQEREINVFHDFDHHATVMLRETQGQGWQTGFVVNVDRILPSPQILRVDGGILGDAEYRVRFSVTDNRTGLVWNGDGWD
jgi:hypothetical protein